MQDIEQDPDMYFIELKYQTVDDKKERLHPGDPFGLATMERNYSNLKFIKVDTVARIRSKFYEITCIYSFKDVIKTSINDILNQLNDDAKEYVKEGNYYKVLKRYFSAAVINNNIGMVDFYVKVFNSDLGKLYQIYCNLKAIELLHTYYKDSSTVEKIDSNLKDIDEKISLTNLNMYIHKYFTTINTAAKKIYYSLQKANKICV